MNITYESLNFSFGSTSQTSSMVVSSPLDLMLWACSLVCLCSPFTRRSTASGTTLPSSGATFLPFVYWAGHCTRRGAAQRAAQRQGRKNEVRVVPCFQNGIHHAPLAGDDHDNAFGATVPYVDRPDDD